MSANIKIKSDSSSFQKQMQDVTKQLKLAQSEFGVASEKAKLFGNATDQLKAKQEGLATKIKLQTQLVELSNEAINKINKDITSYSNKNVELASKIEDVDRRHKEAIETFGKNSNEAKDLKEELNKLKESYSKNEKAIESSNKKLVDSKTKLADNEKALLQTKGALEDVEKELKTSSLDEFNKKLGKVGEGVEKVADVSQKASLAVGAVGLALAKGALDVEESTIKIQAKLGETREEAEELIDTAKDIYEDGFGESIDEIANGLVTLENSFKSAEGWTDEIKVKLMEQIQSISDVFGAENDEILKTLKVMQTSGLIDSVEDGIDMITAGFQKGGDYSGELLDTIREYSPQFVKLGLSADEAMNYLITGAENGAFNLDKVGDAMKEFAIRAQDGSDTTVEGFQLIGLNADEMSSAIALGGDSAKDAFQKTLDGLASIQDPLVQNQAGVDLFGTMWEDLGVNAVTSLADVGGGLEGVSGSAQNLVDTVNQSPTAQWTSNLRELKDSLLPIGNTLLEMAKDAMPSVKEAVEGISNTLKNLTVDDIMNIIKTGMFIFTATSLLTTISTAITGLSSAITIINLLRESTLLATIATQAQTVAQGILNTVMSMNPIGIVIMVIVALVAAFVLAYNKCDWFREMVNKSFEMVKLGVTVAFNAIKNVVMNVWDGIANGVSVVLAIPDKIKNKFDEVKSFFSGLKDHVLEKLRSMFDFNIPHIKLPHFSISGEFSLKPPSIPHLGVEWYADGGIMTQPTLFGMNGLNAMVGGEAGAEAILPVQQLWDNMDRNFDKLEQRLGNNNKAIYINQPIVLDGKEVGRSVAKYVDEENGFRGWN